MALDTTRPLHERPLIYVAGPYTNPDPVVNTRLAIEAADKINDTGLLTGFVPHLTLLWHMVKPHDLEYWYEYDLSVLRRCDGVLRLAGASTGADAEVLFAEQHNIPVWSHLQDVIYSVDS